MDGKDRWSPEFIRTLLTIAAIPVGFVPGFIPGIIVVGAPHAFPGFLMHAPEPVRNRALLICVIGTPALMVLAIWWKPIKKLFD